MMREGFIDLGNGLWQCEKTSKPYSSRRRLGQGKGWAYDGELKELTGKTTDGYYRMRVGGKMKMFHRLIWEHFHGKPVPKNYEIDHINRIKTDNRIENLRLSNRSHQNYNKSKRKDCSSIYKGVTWYKASQKWVAHITLNGKRKHLGYFNTEFEAAIAYDEAVKKYNIPNCPTNKELGLL